MNLVNIDAIIVTPRPLPCTEDLGPLIESIRDTGLQVPVLVTDNDLLIDGLRRMEAMRSLGHTVIETVNVSTQVELLDHLELTHKHGVHERDWLRTRRAYEIYQHFAKLSSKSRSLAYQGVKTSNLSGLKFGSRDRIVRLFELRSDSETQAYVSNYKMFYDDQPGAEEAIQRYESGEVGAYGAQAIIRNVVRRRGTINNLADQRAFLQQIRVTMEALGHSLQEFGRLNPRISQEEVSEYLDSLHTNRATLTRFIRTITKENNER